MTDQEPAKPTRTSPAPNLRRFMFDDVLAASEIAGLVDLTGAPSTTDARSRESPAGM